MPQDDQRFTPEGVEEQIDWLERASRAQPPTPSARVIADLRRLYDQERSDARSVDAGWQRLLERGAVPASERRTRARSGPPTRRQENGDPPQVFSPASPARRGRSPRLLAIAAAVVLVVVVSGLVAGLVLVRQHGPAVSNQPTARPGLTELPGRTPTGTPVPRQVGLYGTVNGNTVVALNPTNGAVLWQYPFTPTGYELYHLSTTNIYIYEPTQDVLTAVNRQDGSQRWRETDARFLGIGNGLVFISRSHGAILSALAERDASQRWTFQPQHGVVQEVVLSADTVYLKTADSSYTNDGRPHNFLYALDVANGKQRWLFQNASYPDIVTVAGDTVYVSVAPASRLEALNVSDGTERWHVDVVGETQFFPPTVADGVVYVPMDGWMQSGGGPAFIYAYRASDGAQLWHSERARTGIVYSEVVVDQGVVYTTDQGNVYAFNATNGQQLWRHPVGFMYDPTTPVIENGLLYVNWYSSGNLSQAATSTSALRESDGQEVWTYAWPKVPASGEGPPSGPGSPTVLNGVVYLYLASTMTALDASNGNQLWQKADLGIIGVIIDS